MTRNGFHFNRRTFLGGIGAAFGSVGLSPLMTIPAPAMPIPTVPSGLPDAIGPTIRLAAYASELRYESLAQDVLQRAKDCIADTVATILFGADFTWSKIIVTQATRIGGNAGKCSILGTGVRVCAPAAALAHGAMTHAFEQDNLTAPDSGAHPGAALVTSGLAVSQEESTSGRELLLAVVAGAEVMIRIGRATLRTNEARGFHAPGTLGPFGAAVVSGKLMKFDTEKMTNALGIAGSTSAGLLEFAHSGNGTMVKRLQLGRAAEGGVLAASLAADGFTGPSTVLEGPAGFLKSFCNASDPTELTRDLGKDYLTLSIMMKRFSCHITAHTAVEAILDFKRQYGISGDEVASIEVVGSHRMATTNNIPTPSDITLGQFSIPFCVALALYRNPVDPYSFNDAAIRDPAIMAMSSRVKITAASGQKDDDVSSKVVITLKDGRVLRQQVTEFLGMPGRPLTGKDMKEKFLLLTQKHPTKQMEHFFDRIQNLENESNLDWLRV